MFKQILKWKKGVEDAELKSTYTHGEYRKRNDELDDDKGDQQITTKQDDIELSDQAKHEKHSGNNSHCLQTITNATHFFDKKENLDVRALGTWRRTRQKKTKSLKSLRKLEIFSSSPSLIIEREFAPDQSRKSSMQFEASATNVLQYTNCEAYGSLITLNITDQLEQTNLQNEDKSDKTSHDPLMNKSIKEDKIQEAKTSSRNNIKVKSHSLIGSTSSSRPINQYASIKESHRTNSLNHLNDQIVINIRRNDCDNDPVMKQFISPDVSHTDADEVTDSDSGIYSLYDSVLITRTLELGHDPDIRVSPSFTQDIDFKFINDAFYEARLLKQLLENARQKFDRKHLHDQIRETRERQDHLRRYLTKLELEKMESTESINILKQQIFKEATNHKFLTKFQSLIDQIDQITNLIFGIEMKLERCSYNECNIINTEMWSSRMAEALIIKSRHNETLSSLIRHNVTVENQLELQEKICIKQRQICQLKLIKAEIYCNEMQLKLFLV